VDEGSDFNLPRLYLALERRFGPSTGIIDDWKQSFCFPLLLKVEPSNSSIAYALSIQNVRSDLDDYQGSFHLWVDSNALAFGCYRGRFYDAQAQSAAEFDNWKRDIPAGKLPAPERMDLQRRSVKLGPPPNSPG